ncbi:hypothetical protein [Candidatus Methanodesulfokora washburnensis]|uniref:Uncharacterized protein n=1 Tax=Candidatus Methanodesulfokora washburnensis TaxID=2478471 RepID=A0A3R9X762_9CREN|nr:hypothetical protein [Candidatus Methanodesulfokores washburnensis]RSN76923.1 hypothetical protein D6D85_03325 [Candidatus Methanodesulfokores washburnensis]
MSLSELNKVVEQPERYFLSSSIVKCISYSDYFPLRLAVKRTDCIKSLKIPERILRRLPNVPIVKGLSKMGIKVEFEKRGFLASLLLGNLWISSSFTCRNCSLTGGQITDGYSEAEGYVGFVEIHFPYRNYVKGRIKAKTRGRLNRMFAGIEVKLDNDVLRRRIEDDDVLMELLRESFESSIVSWDSGITLSVKKMDEREYNVIEFTLNRFTDKHINDLIKRGIDFRKAPELVFDIAERIARKVL